MQRVKAKPHIILSLLLILVFAAHANGASLVWNASQGVVDGYKLHYGTNASQTSNSVNVGSATQYNIDKLNLSENVQYYFCISAYNSAGESAPCPPVAYTPADSTPPAPPVGLVAK
jgi:hypothetical protein